MTALNHLRLRKRAELRDSDRLHTSDGGLLRRDGVEDAALTGSRGEGSCSEIELGGDAMVIRVREWSYGFMSGKDTCDRGWQLYGEELS